MTFYPGQLKPCRDLRDVSNGSVFLNVALHDLCRVVANPPSEKLRWLRAHRVERVRAAA
jgi:hypothetical protein